MKKSFSLKMLEMGGHADNHFVWLLFYKGAKPTYVVGGSEVSAKTRSAEVEFEVPEETTIFLVSLKFLELEPWNLHPMGIGDVLDPDGVGSSLPKHRTMEKEDLEEVARDMGWFTMDIQIPK